MPESATVTCGFEQDESQRDLRHAPRAPDHPADFLRLSAEPAAADRSHDHDAHPALVADEFERRLVQAVEQVVLERDGLEEARARELLQVLHLIVEAEADVADPPVVLRPLHPPELAVGAVHVLLERLPVQPVEVIEINVVGAEALQRILQVRPPGFSSFLL